MDHRKVGGGGSPRSMRSVPAYKKSRHHRPKRKKASHGVKTVPASQKLGASNQANSTAKELQNYAIQPEASSSSRLRSVGKMAGVAVVGTTVGAAATAFFGPAVAVGAAVGGGGLYLINKGWEWWNAKPGASEPDDAPLEDDDDMELAFEDALEQLHTGENEKASLHLENQKIAQENRELTAEAERLREKLQQTEQQLESSREENSRLASEGAHSREEVSLTLSRLNQANDSHRKELESLKGLYWAETEKAQSQKYKLLNQGADLQRAKKHAVKLEGTVKNLELQNELQQQDIQLLQSKVKELSQRLAESYSTFTSQDLPLKSQDSEQTVAMFEQVQDAVSVTDSGISSFVDDVESKGVLSRQGSLESLPEDDSSGESVVVDDAASDQPNVVPHDPTEETRSSIIVKREQEIETLKKRVSAQQKELDTYSDDLQAEASKVSLLEEQRQTLSHGLTALSDAWEQILETNAAFKQEVEQRVQEYSDQEDKVSRDLARKEDVYESGRDVLPDGVRKLKVAVKVVGEKLAAAELAENLMKGLYQDEFDISEVEASDMQKTISELQQFSQLGKDLLAGFDPNVNPESLLGGGVEIAQQQMAETLQDGKLFQKGFDAMTAKGYQGTKESLVSAMLGAKSN